MCAGFPLRVWVEGDQVRVVRWLLTSSTSETTPQPAAASWPALLALRSPIAEPRTGSGTGGVSPHSSRRPGDLQYDKTRT